MLCAPAPCGLLLCSCGGTLARCGASDHNLTRAVGSEPSRSVLNDDHEHEVRRLEGTRRSSVGLAKTLWATTQAGDEDAELHRDENVLRGFAGMGRYPAEVRSLSQLFSAPLGEGSYRCGPARDRRRCVGKTSLGGTEPDAGGLCTRQEAERGDSYLSSHRDDACRDTCLALRRPSW